MQSGIWVPLCPEIIRKDVVVKKLLKSEHHHVTSTFYKQNNPQHCNTKYRRCNELVTKKMVTNECEVRYNACIVSAFYLWVPECLINLEA